MENTNVILATKIQSFRKRCGMTQEELADKLGVTFQAVSKWENEKTCPDITLLPLMADLFDCSIDELFSRKAKEPEILHYYDLCNDLPLRDDGVIRGVVFEGRKVLKAEDGITDKFTFVLEGDALNVQCECNVSISGSVFGGCNAGGDFTVGGDVTGGCTAMLDMQIGGDLNGNSNCAGCVDVGGDVNAGKMNVGEMHVDGDVKAERITGTIFCSSLDSEHIDGVVQIEGKE